MAKQTRKTTRIVMSDFRRAAEGGTIKTWEELAWSFGMDAKTAPYTCEVQEITPSFLQEVQP